MTNYQTTKKLNAYRFNELEFNKIKAFKAIFTDDTLGINKFEIDRYPEVYYDTFENAKKIYPQIENLDCDDNDDENWDDTTKKPEFIRPEYIAIYVWNNEEKNTSHKNTDLKKTQEGVIILFKDRIEKCCEALNININDLRCIVLLHELGHWVTHWPIANIKNWKLGYSAGNHKKTHESLAQLIAYWLIKNDKNLLHILSNYLTPPNDNNPYALYKKLTTINTSEIINRLNSIRGTFYLTDDYCFDVLCGKVTFKGSNSDGFYWIDNDAHKKNYTATIAENKQHSITEVKKALKDPILKDKGRFVAKLSLNSYWEDYDEDILYNKQYITIWSLKYSEKAPNPDFEIHIFDLDLAYLDVFNTKYDSNKFTTPDVKNPIHRIALTIFWDVDYNNLSSYFEEYFEANEENLKPLEMFMRFFGKKENGYLKPLEDLFGNI